MRTWKGMQQPIELRAFTVVGPGFSHHVKYVAWFYSFPEQWWLSESRWRMSDYEKDTLNHRMWRSVWHFECFGMQFTGPSYVEENLCNVFDEYARYGRH